MPPPIPSRVLKNLKPGASGTKRLLKRFGKDLLRVRYRESENGEHRLTTVEIVVSIRKAPKRPEQIVDIYLNPHERELRQLLLKNGGQWDVKNRVWRVTWQTAKALKLEDRIQENAHI